MKSIVKRFISSFLFVVLAASAMPSTVIGAENEAPTTKNHQTACKVTPLDVCFGLLALAVVSFAGWKLSTTLWGWLFKKPIEKKVEQLPSDKQIVPVEKKPVGVWDSIKDWFSEKPVFDDTVTVSIAGSDCIGIERELNPDARIVALKVICQFDPDGGGGASCGYHPVKNFIVVRNGLDAPEQGNLQKNLLDPGIIAATFGPTGTWRKHIQAKSTERKDGEWVKDIDSIIRFEQENGGGAFMQPQTDYNFTVIDTIELVGLIDAPEKGYGSDDTKGLVCPITLAIKESLVTEGDYVHGFAIQTGNQMKANWDESEKPSGHWKLLVFHKTRDGKREYILCNSSNATGLDDHEAEVIIAVIEGLAANRN